MKNGPLKWISTLLVLALLINMLPMSIFAEKFQASIGETETVSQPLTQEEVEDAYVVSEITENRTAYSKEFLLSNGLHMATVYADAVHYETEDGWQEIDNTLQVNRDGTYANTAGVWDVQFPGQLSSNSSVTIEKDGYTLSFFMAGRLNQGGSAVVASAGETVSLNGLGSTGETFAVASTQTSLAKLQKVDLTEAKAAAQYEQQVQDKLYSQLSYANLYANTDLVYDLQSNKVKESVILSRYDSTLRGYRYTLNTGGMIPVLDDTGHIEFYDADMENIIMTMSAPFLVDANNCHNFDIQVQLTGSGNTYTLTYLLPQQWLADSERAYPVILDPSVSAGTGSSNIADQTVCSNGSLSHTWGMVECGYYGNLGIERFFLAFKNLPELDSIDRVQNVTVSLYKAGASTTPFFVNVHDCDDVWSSSTITWDNMPPTSAVAVDSVEITTAQWYDWDVTDIADYWYSSGENTGMMFKAHDAVEAAGLNAWVQFYSSDYGVNSPRLTITYIPAEDIDEGDYITVTLPSSGEKKYFYFRPVITGFYTFESCENVGDPHIELFNSNFESLASSDDDGEDYNFQLTYHFREIGEYYIALDDLSANGGSYDLYVYTPLSPATESMITIFNDSRHQVENKRELDTDYFAFTPTTSGEYLFYSTKDSQNASCDPSLYLYDSSNCKVNTSTADAGDLNFRVVASLTAGQTYYLVATQYLLRTGTYNLNIIMVADIPCDDYHLRNAGTGLYLDTHGPDAQTWVHQQAYSWGLPSSWSFQKQSDGYYIIQSLYGNEYYVGISNQTVGVENIKLYSKISDNTRWKIYAKSSGELFLEPKTAPGKVLYAPNSSDGTELRLAYMSASVANRNKWKFELHSPAPLEGQQRSKWCWAAAARMFVNHYMDVPSERSQEAAVTAVKGSPINDGGTYDNYNAICNYYSSGSINETPLDIFGSSDSIYSEQVVRWFLKDGHVLLIGRGKYNENNERYGGHSYVIAGYTARFYDGVLQYRYLINNPWPQVDPNPWEEIIVTEGQLQVRSYQWICNGRNALWGETEDDMIWETFVTVETAYCMYTTEIVWD